MKLRLLFICMFLAWLDCSQSQQLQNTTLIPGLVIPDPGRGFKVNYMQVGCTTVFETNVTNPDALIKFFSVGLKINHTKSVREFPVFFGTPFQSRTGVAKVLVSYGLLSQEVSLTTKANCCNIDAVKQEGGFNCAAFSLRCAAARKCQRITFTVENYNFYTTGCTTCFCTYCYGGGEKLSALIEFNSNSNEYLYPHQFPSVRRMSAFQWNIPSYSFSESGITFLNMSLKKKSVDVPNSGNNTDLQKYFSIKIRGNNTLVFVRTNKSQIIPEMQQLVYFKDPGTSSLYPIKLFIYPKPNCTLTQVIKEIILQSPSLQVNCKNISQRPLIFNLKSAYFAMSNNSIYLTKQFSGFHIMKLSIQYADLPRAFETRMNLNISLFNTSTTTTTTTTGLPPSDNSAPWIYNITAFTSSSSSSNPHITTANPTPFIPNSTTSATTTTPEMTTTPSTAPITRMTPEFTTRKTTTPSSTTPTPPSTTTPTPSTTKTLTPLSTTPTPSITPTPSTRKTTTTSSTPITRMTAEFTTRKTVTPSSTTPTPSTTTPTPSSTTPTPSTTKTLTPSKPPTPSSTTNLTPLSTTPTPPSTTTPTPPSTTTPTPPSTTPTPSSTTTGRTPEKDLTSPSNIESTTKSTVNAASLKGVAVEVNLNDSVTFSCSIEGSIGQTVTQWFTNGTRVIQPSLRRENGDRVDAYITWRPAPKNAVVSCKWFLTASNVFVGERQFHTSQLVIPHVTIRAPFESKNNTLVNFRCSSNSPGANVTIGVSTMREEVLTRTGIGHVSGNFTIQEITEIACRASYNAFTGPMETRFVLLSEGPKLSMIRFEAVQHSVDNVTVTCEADSNSGLWYWWYVNGVQFGGETYRQTALSSITLKDLSENTLVTCIAVSMNENLTNSSHSVSNLTLSTESFPSVTIISPTVSANYSLLDFRCYSNRQGATVRVVVVESRNNRIIINDTRRASYSGTFKMVSAARITCYAEGDGRIGIRKHRTIGLVFIKMDEIRTTLSDRNAITFSSGTKISKGSPNGLQYKWRINDTLLSSGSKLEANGSTAVGSLTVTSLQQKDSGRVACEVYLNESRVAKRELKFDVSQIPRVTIAADAVAAVDATVQYSCSSTVKGATVFLKYGDAPEKVTERNGTSNVTGRFTIKKKTDISCHAEYKLLKGPPHTVSVFILEVGKQTCEKEKKGDIIWPKTLASQSAKASCPEGFDGSLTRQCKDNGEWADPNDDECVKQVLVDVMADLDKLSNGLTKDISTPVKSLATATTTKLKAKEMTLAIDAVDKIVDVTQDSADIQPAVITNFFDICSNIVDERNSELWDDGKKDTDKKTGNSAQNMMKNIEKFGTIVAGVTNESKSFDKPNFVVNIQRVPVNETQVLPNLKTLSATPKWVQSNGATAKIPSKTFEEIYGKNKTVSVVSTLFKSLSKILPTTQNQTQSVNSLILSISLQNMTISNLTNPISLTFQHLSEKLINANCSFWDFNKLGTAGGGWSSNGCYRVVSNQSATLCNCTHLTNFAILMNPTENAPSTSYNLRIITLVCTWISVVTLITTILVYITCWKHVSSRDVAKSRSVLLINLCVALICVYLIFMFGIEKKDHPFQDSCTAVAILLLYFLLVTFFAMLSEGIDIFIALTVVFTLDCHRLPWLVALPWVVPAFIVGIAAWATELEGFGGEKYCWLSRETGLIWAFIGPVIVIITANVMFGIFALRALMSAGSSFKHTTEKSIASRIRKGARAIIILSPLLGFTWIIGLFAVNDLTDALEYVFSILTSLQGFFIFAAYCLFNEKLREAFSNSKFTTTYLSTKQATVSHSKIATKASKDSNSSESKSSIDDNLSDNRSKTYSNKNNNNNNNSSSNYYNNNGNNIKRHSNIYS